MKQFALCILMISFLSQAKADTLASGGGGISTMAIAGAAVNTGVAAFMFTKCNPTPTGALFCAMGATSALQALSDLKQNNGSAVTSAASDYTGASNGTAPTSSTADSGLAQKLATQDQAIIQAAAGKGVTLSADGSTVTMPDGSSLSSSQLGSDANLKKAGLDDSQIAQLKADAADAAAKAKSQFNLASMPTDGGGGGALNMRNSNADDGSDAKLKSLLGALGKGAERKPSSMSGLSKKLGSTGENIGVAGDDIFQMITRQYQRKDSQNTFIKDAASPRK